MGQVTKPVRDVDDYQCWDWRTVGIVFTGTRAEMAAYLEQTGQVGDGNRLNRADLTGSSADFEVCPSPPKER
jgi:hypothetical protein